MKEEEGEGDSYSLQLQRASSLINTLISSSFSVQSFPSKWKSIRDKLEKLGCSLTTCEISSDYITELDELLRTLTATVKQAQLLADQCCNESYTGGKLRLRSDLDIIISQLDHHAKQLDKIFASGVLTHTRAIVLTRPAAGSTRQDMRLYVKDLLSRLRVGGSELKVQALSSLNEILAEDDKYVRIVSGESDSGVSLLISFLDSGDKNIQEEASRAVSVIAGFDSLKGDLAVSGVIGPLIRVLETGTELSKERAAGALRRMTENSENSWSVLAQGGVSILLRICGSCNSSKELIFSACGVLKNICAVSEIKRFMVDEGAILVFAKLVQSRDEELQIQAVEFLAILSSEDEAVKQRLIRERVIDSLVKLLDPNSLHSSKAREVTLREIEKCCFSSANCVAALMSSGFVDRLLFFLKHGEISVQESALKSVSRLCAVSEEAKRVMGDLGFMPEFLKLLDVRSFEVRELAAESLCSLISVQRNRRKFAQEGHNVNRILQLLDPQEEKPKPVAMNKLLLSILLILTDSSSGRRNIAASVYVKNLHKLAENDVSEAKQIVKKLHSSRFRTMLHRIWSS